MSTSTPTTLARCIYCGTFLTGTESHWCDRMNPHYQPVPTATLQVTSPSVTEERIAVALERIADALERKAAGS